MENILMASSLECAALTKIATSLWNPDDIMFDFTQTASTNRSGKPRSRDELENKVKAKALALPLPKSVKKKLVDFVQLVGWEIFHWKWCNERILYKKQCLRQSLKKICWAPQGKIDYQKTAEKIIEDESLDIVCRYRLACVNCLVTDIRALWAKIPKRCRNSVCANHPSPNYQESSIIFWTLEMRWGAAELDRVTKALYYYDHSSELTAPAYNCGKPANGYFLPKLTPEEREQYMIPAAVAVAASRCYKCYFHPAPINRMTQPLRAYLSQINTEEQLEVFKHPRIKLPNSILDWPWQDLLKGTYEGMWTVLSQQANSNLLKALLIKILHNDYNIQELFLEVWRQNPSFFREFVHHYQNTYPNLLD